MKLKELDCRRCPNCNSVYFDWWFLKEKTCTPCQIETIEEKCYSRFRVERFTLIYLISFVFTLSLFTVLNKEENLLSMGAVALFLILSLVLIPGMMLFMFFLVNEYLTGRVGESKKNKNDKNIIKEYYVQEEKPNRENIGFSGKKFVKEFFTFVGFLMVFVFLGAGITLMGKLFN